MTSTAAPRPVVVGIGPVGLEPSVLDFAVAEAVRSGAPLRLVHAYAVPPSTVDGFYGFDFPETFRLAGEELLAEAVDRVAAERPNLTVTSLLVRGTATSLLEDESRTARLVVLGHDGDTPLLLRLFEGRTAQHLARCARCPVVVVPERWRDPGTGCVVVALLDRAAPDRAALDVAVVAARERSCGVSIVHADLHAGLAAERLLTDTVADVGEDACLLVVARVPSGLSTLLGHSVLRAVVSRSPCPVVVVPPGWVCGEGEVVATDGFDRDVTAPV